ncbi:MAG: hypothetical protein ACLSG8_07465 [Barnesiella sp.]
MKVASATFRLEPGSNGQQELPLTLLVKRMLTCYGSCGKLECRI